MTAAVALAVVLVIAVAGMSLAMQTQQRPARPQTRSTGPTRRPRERRPAPQPDPPKPQPADPEPEWKGPELLRSGETANAKVVSVVDERTLGPVTRSRLVLSIQATDGDPFEATIRAAFPTPAARAAVKVGGTVAVRYDKDNRTRVVLDTGTPASSPPPSPPSRPGPGSAGPTDDPGSAAPPGDSPPGGPAR
ncbi:MAG: hypothetical protein ACRDZY_00945 [Acidimicrobiales bacterium]